MPVEFTLVFVRDYSYFSHLSTPLTSQQEGRNNADHPE